MAEMTLDQILQAASKLPPDEQQELIRRLRTARARQKAEKGSIEDIPVLDLGPWPEDWPPRREELYDDEHRAGLR